ncbi:hypothetical protein [Rhizohabitans arisaemae]|uniref:hypothetical protein n=1 Tax=Rhizohabitans arisaemae TaxID=2720610 RepID=UPI0024B10C29|nr:hypothetical protein [Rhizohabitans arisaemae]
MKHKTLGIAATALLVPVCLLAFAGTANAQAAADRPRLTNSTSNTSLHTPSRPSANDRSVFMIRAAITVIKAYTKLARLTH